MYMTHLKKIILSIGYALLSATMWASPAINRQDTPTYPAMRKMAGVQQPVISLDGNWQFRYNPTGKWFPIQVPGEPAMQGFAIEHDKPYTYRKAFTVPADYKGKKSILRFDGVYSLARLRVNGVFVREHSGGFTRWETDITPWIKPGKNNVIEVEITDPVDEISYASGYAHHPIGGILRSVSLLAQPENGLTDFYIETALDSIYQNAILKVGYLATQVSPSATLSFTLTDPAGRLVRLERDNYPLSAITTEGQTIDIPIDRPIKWDAEHPNLYHLSVSIHENGKEAGNFSRLVGFRDVRVVKDRMLVNGQAVKLRGACRHDIHPLLGRTTTAELDSLDVVRFKESNMNFVRTSHYPPSEKFLEYCDRMGLYVECETAVCFVDTHRQKNYAPGATHDNPAFANRYLSQCQEMVRSFRSHASILFWSIGNESKYGKNFQVCWDWVKATDNTRPVVFSYPGSVEQKEKIYDILSMHYQNVDGDLNQWGMTTRNFQGHGLPVLFDEWAHPACYTYKTLQDDPNIREFWGISLDKMWSGLFPTSGGLGGAIWGYIDETFALPAPKMGTSFWKEFAYTAKPKDYQGNCVGYGEWGIVDVWRRPKPEFWATKKAYSPVKVLLTEVPDFTAGQRLVLPVYNRFDHTNLNELKVRYTYKGIEKELSPLALAPHQKGMLVIPAESWENGEPLLVRFLTTTGELIDAEQITLGSKTVEMPKRRTGNTLEIDETADRLIVRGNGFEIPFDKSTGLISQATSNGKVIIESGPFLHLDINLNHLTGAEVRKRADNFKTVKADWKKRQFAYEQKDDRVVVSIAGRYGQVEVDMYLSVFADGRMEMDYLTDGEPNGYLRETGLSFHLPATIDHLDWNRKGHWSYYLPGAFAGNEGSTSLYVSRQSAYAKEPVQEWQHDTHNYYYWADAGADCKQPLTSMAKGMKENVYYYTLSTTAGQARLSVVSPDQSVACRLSKQANEQLTLFMNNRWDYPEIAWGNYCKTLEATPCYGKIIIQF